MFRRFFSRRRRHSDEIAPEIVRIGAVGVAVAANASGNLALAERIEEAQHAAIRDCHARGIIDPDILREKMREARETALEIS